MPTRNPSQARQLWQLLEPIAASLYYAPEVKEEAAALGFDAATRWPSYFAWRSAPLGAAGPNLVAATYYSFNPRMVREHVPGIWRTATPDAVLAARTRGLDRALRTLWPDAIDGPDLAETARLARRVAEAAENAGRPLAAANADLPWPHEPQLQLWHAANLLREHRGDGHIAALALHGLDPVESLVSFAAVGAAPVEVFASRGWSAEAWSAAQDRLRERGLVTADGTATSEGQDLRDSVESKTDELAAAPWRVLGPEVGRLVQLTMPLMRAVVATGMLPSRSTLGIRRDAAPGD